jgi:L-seryl-tRNA(Ser) seleniumtransferase
MGIVSRHPLARAVRIDKLSLAALAATLLHYVREEATRKIPVWRMVTMSVDDLEAKAGHWVERLGRLASVEPALSTIGGGSLPGETLPTRVVAVDAKNIDGGAAAIAGRLRHGNPPVVGRIEEERIMLDPRTVLPEEEESLLDVIKDILDQSGER